MSFISNKIDNLKKEINNSYDNNIQNQQLNTDPRVDNKILPNDSEITYSFGALAYTTDTYPGYVWRNGSWYKIKKNLSFTPHSAQRIVNFKKNISTTNYYTSIDSIDVNKLKPCQYINDAFRPIMYYDYRYFICVSDNLIQNRYFCTLYVPCYKGTCTLSLWAKDLEKLKYERLNTNA